MDRRHPADDDGRGHGCAGDRRRPLAAMVIRHLNPILNVSNVRDSIAWFEKLGWQKGFEWEEPPSFGSVCCSGFEVFLCRDGQGSRGKSPFPNTFGPDGDDGQDK